MCKQVAVARHVPTETDENTKTFSRDKECRVRDSNGYLPSASLQRHRSDPTCFHLYSLRTRIPMLPGGRNLATLKCSPWLRTDQFKNVILGPGEHEARTQTSTSEPENSTRNVQGQVLKLWHWKLSYSVLLHLCISRSWLKDRVPLFSARNSWNLTTAIKTATVICHSQHRLLFGVTRNKNTFKTFGDDHNKSKLY